jgi:hypothetical protein
LEFFAINTEGRSRKFFTTNSEGSKNRKQEVEVTAPKTIQLLPLIVIPIVKILTETTDLTTLTPHGSFVDAVRDALEVGRGLISMHHCGLHLADVSRQISAMTV